MFRIFAERYLSPQPPSHAPQHADLDIGEKDVGTGARSHSFLSGFARTIQQSFVPGALSMSDSSPERQALNAFIEDAAGTSKPDEFSQAVGVINSNFARHGDTNLSPEKSAQYQQLIKDRSEGKISRTTAFANSAAGWASEFQKTGSPQSAVGALFNLAGSGVAGALDANSRKLGKD